MSKRKPNTGLGNVIFTLALILAKSDLTSTSYVTLTRTGYQNVVVSIEENSGFSNCKEGLDSVKELIRETSKNFGQALVRPAYFGNVTVIFPDSWANDSFCMPLMTSANISDLPWARRHRADIRITPDHPVFGWQPHSFQYGGCQKSGLPVNVPSSFMKNVSVLAKAMRMAREWAHYRYGVFDEGGMPDDQRHPSAYLMFQTDSSDKILRPNTCSDLQTPSGSWNSENCKSAASAGPNCEYVADVYNPNIHSSLMYRPDLDHMDKFCTKENHDDGVPSKLSYHCGSLSASEVIYKHPDFNPVVTPANLTADIIFNVIQNPFSGYHVVLDMASFKDADSFETARSSLLQFFVFIMDPITVSVDIYNGYNVTELQNPIVLDQTTKQNLLSDIEALKYLNNFGNSDKFGLALERAQSRANEGLDVLILTSLQTFSDLNNWIKSYEENKVNVHLVYFGVSTIKVEIAQLSRYGSAHFLPNIIDSRLMSVYTWAVNTLQSIWSQTRTHRAKIFEQPIIHNSTSDLNKTGSFYLDSPASRLLVSFYCSDAQKTLKFDSFTLIQPDGLRNATFENLIDFDDFYAFTIETTVEPLPSGLWRFEIIFNSGALTRPDKRLDIWAESSSPSQVQLRTWNSATDNQPLDFIKAPVGLYAQLTQNNKPVRGANVTAFVYVSDSSGSTSKSFENISLTDDGIADVTSGDGIYSGFMTKPSNSSLIYSVYYLAYGVNSLAQVDNGTYNRPPTTGSVIPMSDPVPAVSQFSRFSYGPSFQLTSVPSNGFDQIPPLRVTDFTIVSYDSSTRKVSFGWTVSKDNYGSGEVVTHYRLIRTVGSGQPTNTEYQNLSVADGAINLTVEVPPVGEGEYVKYRIQSRDSSSNYGDVSNVVSLAGPPPPNGGLSTGIWVLIGVAIALIVIILIVILICCCCPVSAKRKRRQAQRKIRKMFSSKDKATTRVEDTPVTRYQSPPPTIEQWQSPAMSRDGDLPAVRRESDSSNDRQQPKVEIRQKTANPAPGSIQGSERIYFGKEDIDRMTTGHRSETYSERGTEEMIKRAPSMDLQLATILRMNSSNMSVNQVGLEESYEQASNPAELTQPRVYARPYKPNPVVSRPVSSQVTSRGFSYIHPNNKPLSQSETNLYYTDVALRPPVGQSTKSSPTNSYMSVYAERADVVPQHQQTSGQSSLANTLMRANEEWQDSNSFIYTDPRFEGQSKGPSSFDPKSHPANKVGLPPALPTTVPPPLLPRTYDNAAYENDFRASQMADDHYEADLQRMSRSSSKPSLVSAV